MRSISSRQNAVVQWYRDAALDASDEGTTLLLDGVHLVRDARAAGLLLRHVAVSAKRMNERSEVAELAATLEHEGVDVATVTEPVMDALSPVRTPSGIIAIAARTPATVAAICAHPAALIVAAVGVQDPGNVGGVIRAAEAGGATGVIPCGASASPFSWKAVRGSMGSVLRLPVACGDAAGDVLACARKAKLRTVASVPRGGQTPDALDWRGRVLMFVGGEGPGLPDTTIAKCDARVTIPMQPPVESLNVAVAAALLVYEARRQRT